MSEKLSFIGGEEPAEGEIVSEALAPEAVAEAPRATPEPGQVPISALLDERDKRQAAEKARADYERQLEVLRQTQAPQQPPPADVQVRQALYDQHLRASRRFAEREYGKDTVAQVHDWAFQRCAEDPIFNQQMLASEDPYEAAQQAFNREQILAEVSPDRLAAFKAWEAAQAAAEASPTPNRAAAAPPPPRSLATATNAGGPGAATTVNIGPGEAFSAAITR